MSSAARDGGPAETSLSEALRSVAEPLWNAQLAHPFVRGLGDGTLEEECFKRWVRQDYLYLQEFARIFAWAAARARSLDSMGWYAAVLDLTLNTEMELHRRYAERFGITPGELEAEPMWPTTRAYTDFLVRTAAEGDRTEVLAALLPCSWGYLHVGRTLASGPRPDDDRYAEWIEQYASDEFAEATDWLKAELDREGAGADGPTRRRLEHIFLVSSEYELRFWEMCWRGEEPLVRIGGPGPGGQPR